MVLLLKLFFTRSFYSKGWGYSSQIFRLLLTFHKNGPLMLNILPVNLFPIFEKSTTWFACKVLFFIYLFFYFVNACGQLRLSFAQSPSENK